MHPWDIKRLNMKTTHIVQPWNSCPAVDTPEYFITSSK